MTGPSPGAISSRRVSRPADRRGRRRRRRRVLSILLVLLAGLGMATARLLVWPQQGMPARVDAIVMLDGPGDRLAVALRLAREHRAPMLVISRGTPYSSPGVSGCGARIPGVRVICFNPDPATTQGEAEAIGRLAVRHHWHSIVLVTTTPQDTRARLRVGRCFGGDIYVMTAPVPASEWPDAIFYEWGAIIKALVLQRSC
jgi:hypothetical protein